MSRRRDRSDRVTVMWSKNFDDFSVVRGQRTVSPKHVAELRESMKQHGFLIDNAIVCFEEGARLRITDGQHRFEAARGLDIEFAYLKFSKAEAMLRMDVHNTTNKAWRLNDYMVRHSVRNPNYVAISSFMERNSLAVSLMLSLLEVLLSRRPKSISDDFKLGAIVFDDEAVSRGDAIMEQFRELCGLYDGYREIAMEKRFFVAVLRVMMTHGYCHEQMMRKLKLRRTMLVKCPGAKEYAEVLRGIYNYGKGDKIQVMEALS